MDSSTWTSLVVIDDVSFFEVLNVRRAKVASARAAPAVQAIPPEAVRCALLSRCEMARTIEDLPVGRSGLRDDVLLDQRVDLVGVR